MDDNIIRIVWIIFWSLIAIGWSVVSFQWLRKSVEEIHHVPEGQKPTHTGIILRRFAVFAMVGGLLYLALRTEPLAAVAMVFVITVAIWIQVILYNSRVNKTRGHKEK